MYYILYFIVFKLYKYVLHITREAFGIGYQCGGDCVESIPASMQHSESLENVFMICATLKFDGFAGFN